MESPVASSSTASDGPPKSNSTSTGVPSFPGVPSPAPPFFANPFMTPFMSQQPGPSSQTLPNGPSLQQMQQQFQQFAAVAAAAAGGDPTAMQAPSDIRMNPFTGGFFLPPNQYQEMMQQYLQSLMLQAGNAPPPPPSSSERQTPIMAPSTVMAQSPSPPLASNDPAAAAFNGLATLNLGQLNLASPTTAAPTPPPAMTTAATTTPMAFNSSNSRQSTPSKVSSASVGIASGGASTNCSSSPSPSFENIKDQQRPSSMTQDRPESTPVIDIVAPMEPSAKEDLEESKEDPVEEISDEPPKRKFDARADELFRKQMNEIEQEINRRIQNRNVRKLNEEELSQLLNETGFGNFVEAGKPNSEVSEQMGHLIREPSPPPAPKNPTLNQLRSSFSPPETKGPVMGLDDDPFPAMQPTPLPAYPFSFGSVQMAQPPSEPATAPFMSTSTPYSVQHHQPRQTTPVGYIPGLDPPPQPQPMESPQNSSTLPNPATITPEMAALLLKQIQESNPQLLSSLGLVPASQVQQEKKADDPEAYRLPAPPSAAQVQPRRNGATNSFHANGASTSLDENGWKQLDKRHSLNGDNAIHQTSTTGPENNKENSQEPIWVMRDSYLKRLQREEQRNKELQNGTAGSSNATGQNGGDDELEETDKLLNRDHNAEIEEQIKSNKKPASAKKEVLIEGVLFRARYLGSTQLTCDGRPTKSSRMAQAQEAVARVKAPDGEMQPSTEIDLFISTEKIMILNTDLQRISETDVRQDILMDHGLRTISYIADIGDVVVLMARRPPQNTSTGSEDEDLEVRRTPRVTCHIFESEEASFIAQSIGQAFQVAYVEFLRANGIDDPAYLREIDYQEVLNSQELLGEELDLFSNKETQKDIVIPKKVGEPLGIVVVESGWGSMLPTVVVAKMEPNAPSARSNQLNIGDQIIAINGISLVGLPLAKAQQNIKNAKTSTAVRLTIVSTPPVVEVRIRRPDTKYQLGFSVQNGVICSLLRGGIAERGGIRVGHRIIEINHKSVVAIPHEKIVNMLATATGEIHMKTMPTSMYRLLTGQEVPNYI